MRLEIFIVLNEMRTGICIFEHKIRTNIFTCISLQGFYV